MYRFKISLFVFLVTALSYTNIYGQLPVKNYEKEWKKVTALVEKKLPKSALEEVKKIYTQAKKDNQDAQVIKSLVTMIGLQEEISEENGKIMIRDLESEIQVSKEPARSILYNLLASAYQAAYNQRRWILYRRTQTAPDFKQDDLDTWSAADFHKKISEYFLLSIKNEKLLQQTRLSTFDAIILKGNVRHLRPTLYDLLAHRALDYLENNDRDIRQPSYAFQITEASAFDPAADFVKRNFQTADSLSLQHKALLVYQKLIAFHLTDSKPDALIDVDLARLQFVRRFSVHPDKEQQYLNALVHISNQYGKHPAASQALYLQAAFYEQRAATYQPYGDTTYRYDRVKAKEILARILAQPDSSEGKINAFNLDKIINAPELQFEVEKVNVPGQPFRALIQYRNFNTVYLRLIKATDNIKTQLENQYDEKYWTAILAAKTEKSWQQVLPLPADMQTHKAEIKIDALPPGDYILIAGNAKDFNNSKTRLGARFFYVSNISFVSNLNDYFVLNRENGQPLVKAAVQVWEQEYDYKQSKYVRVKKKLYQTDNNGFFRSENPKTDGKNYRHTAMLLDITHNGDRLYMNDWIYEAYFDRNNPAAPVTSDELFLFADRGLYRPGQTIYFKGIILERNLALKTNKAKAGHKTKIYLRDANYQDIDSLELASNEFGSFNGSFQLPASGLNGQFNLYSKKINGLVAFNVEEYKRPKFYVGFDTLKGAYEVNDRIRLTGIAKAYAGNNIDGAIVRYRVVREPRFLYPWMFRRWWQPPVEPMEIAQGETKSGKDGKFTIEFTAIPDLKIDKKFDPVFDYKIYADVTDINGETRSGEMLLSVSYKSVLLKTALPTTLPADSFKLILVRTENMNGSFEPSQVKVAITKLKQENRLIRPRYWERPDQFVMSKDEYLRDFPMDEYNNESDPSSWEKEAIVYEKTSSVNETGNWNLADKKFSPGFYMVEFTTTDKKGNQVKDVRYIDLFDENNPKLDRPQYLWSMPAKPIEPGETATVKLGSSSDNLFVIQQVDKSTGRGNSNAGINYSFLKLDRQKKNIDFAATEADRGGFGTSWIFVKHNRVFYYEQTIVVPWSNKDLAIEFATYRDKTLPGSEERWKLKLTGFKKEKLAAEMLAGMYDASLDQFYPHSWSKPDIWPYYNRLSTWNATHNFIRFESIQKYIAEIPSKELVKNYDVLLAGVNGYDGDPRLMRLSKNSDYLMPESEQLEGKAAGVQVGNTVVVSQEIRDSSAQPPSATAPGKPGERVNTNADPIAIRRNFQETAFFFPELRTDSAGNIEFSFTIPEALTRWKFMALAHTREGALGFATKEIITQKELMVQPNAPRFVREGDKIEFSSKIVNLTDKEITGTAELRLVDALTNQSVDGWFKNIIPNQYFTVAAGESGAILFPIEIPYLFNKALTWRIVAKAQVAGTNYSDGEENSLPVLTNRMLVTETLPLNVKGPGITNFQFDKLIGSANSETIKHHAITIEYTSNPAWFAIQALPYLMEYPYDCAEQTWNRYYANSLASYIVRSSPKIREVFEKWKIKDTAALLSNLQKNQELKAVLLEETPWVLQAKSEEAQKKQIALLFDVLKMSQELNASLEKLKQMQSPNGGFVWFKGGPDDRFITQYIVSGIGHLKKLGAITDDNQQSKLNQILATAIHYLDNKLKEEYDLLVKNKVNQKTYIPGATPVQYFYMRSFFPEYKIAAGVQTAYNFFKTKIQTGWTTQSKYMQGMTALALFRMGDTKTPAAIIKSLKETSIVNEELGMYWKDAGRSWWWYEAPIERQALMIEAFQEITKDKATVDQLRTWLLKNKQTNNWNTTKATAEACYALLLQGSDWLAVEPTLSIKLGNTTISSTGKSEAGTGYFKQVVDGPAVQPSMGNISVTSNQPANTTTWGSVYWQYFEDLDKISTAATPLKLVKKLFIEKNTDRGPVLNPVSDGAVLKIGDKIKVRVELRVDRDMEYVHMKDMRASALEPVNVLSSYKWQGGLGYYETTRDASTNFFFNYLRKGTYVFEYQLFVTHAGNFSNGITSIQCMYAPEFSAHSEGIRINVE